VRRDPLRRVWRPPGEATVRRVLARVDPDALDLAIGRWLADQDQPQPFPPPPRRAGTIPRAMASLRNLAIGTTRVLPLLGITSP
jgi:hypothetical protein